MVKGISKVSDIHKHLDLQLVLFAIPSIERSLADPKLAFRSPACLADVENETAVLPKKPEYRVSRGDLPLEYIEVSHNVV